jgi:beta-galactosidase
MNKLLSGYFYLFFLVVAGAEASPNPIAIGSSPKERTLYHASYNHAFHSLSFGEGRGEAPIRAGGVSRLRAAVNPIRETISFNTGWKFHLAYDVRKQPETINVTLPHTWNAQDVLSGKGNYQRESGIYEKSFTLNPNLEKQAPVLVFRRGQLGSNCIGKQTFCYRT